MDDRIEVDYQYFRAFINRAAHKFSSLLRTPVNNPLTAHLHSETSSSSDTRARRRRLREPTTCSISSRISSSCIIHPPQALRSRTCIRCGPAIGPGAWWRLTDTQGICLRVLISRPRGDTSPVAIVLRIIYPDTQRILFLSARNYRHLTPARTMRDPFPSSPAERLTPRHPRQSQDPMPLLEIPTKILAHQRVLVGGKPRPVVFVRESINKNNHWKGRLNTNTTLNT